MVGFRATDAAPRRFKRGHVYINDDVLAVVLDVDGPFGADADEIRERLQARYRRQNIKREVLLRDVEEALRVLTQAGRLKEA